MPSNTVTAHPGARLAPRDRDASAEDAEAALAAEARRYHLSPAAVEDDGEP